MENKTYTKYQGRDSIHFIKTPSNPFIQVYEILQREFMIMESLIYVF